MFNFSRLFISDVWQQNDDDTESQILQSSQNSFVGDGDESPREEGSGVVDVHALEHTTQPAVGQQDSENSGNEKRKKYFFDCSTSTAIVSNIFHRLECYLYEQWEWGQVRGLLGSPWESFVKILLLKIFPMDLLLSSFHLEWLHSSEFADKPPLTPTHPKSFNSGAYLNMLTKGPPTVIIMWTRATLNG